MMNIKSMSHCTRNENGFEEVQLVFEKTAMDSILRRKGRTIIAEKKFGRWCYYGTEEHVSSGDEKAIFECIDQIKYGNFALNKSLERFKL